MTKLLLIAGVALAANQLHAQVLWSDNFSSYNVGTLDANSSSPNPGPNGGPGNPWWGPAPPNLSVATSYNGINPYPGDTKLADGTSAGNFSVEEVNLGYRFNGGNNLTGNVALSWAFYDPAGSGASAANYTDAAYLNGYQSADGYINTTDYKTSAENLQGSFTSGDEILGIGANNPSGYNSSVYQVRLLGDAIANNGSSYTGANGWFNTGVSRSVGWHTASIVLGAPSGASTAVSMYIDGRDVLDGTMGATTMDSVNTLVVDSGWGSQVGAFDNFALTAVPEPGMMALFVGGSIAAYSGLRRHRK